MVSLRRAASIGVFATKIVRFLKKAQVVQEKEKNVKMLLVIFLLLNILDLYIIDLENHFSVWFTIIKKRVREECLQT